MQNQETYEISQQMEVSIQSSPTPSSHPVVMTSRTRLVIPWRQPQIHVASCGDRRQDFLAVRDVSNGDESPGNRRALMLLPHGKKWWVNEWFFQQTWSCWKGPQRTIYYSHLFTDFPICCGCPVPKINKSSSADPGDPPRSTSGNVHVVNPLWNQHFTSMYHVYTHIYIYDYMYT